MLSRGGVRGLPDPAYLFRQKAFDVAASHLLAQGEPALVPCFTGTRCVYRTRRGLRCAIGALIEDRAFDPSLNGEPLSDPRVIAMLSDSGWDRSWSSTDAEFLSSLQSVHDDAPRVTKLEWRKGLAQGLANISRRYRLKVNYLDPHGRWQDGGYLAHQDGRLDTERPGNGDELDDVQPSLKLLDLVDE